MRSNMKPTVEYIEKKFEEYNRLMFGGRLPKIRIELSDASSFLGVCVADVKQLPDGRKAHSNFRLKINTRIDLPEQVVEDTIIHEMIHYFIFYNELCDTSAHGEIFKAIMASINATFNRHLTISHKSTAEQSEQAVSQKRVWRVIAAIHFKSGRVGVKVLPRVAPRIMDYHSKMMKQAEVERIDLYLHDNPFFNRYPSSAALRVYELEADVLERNLEGAKELMINGSQVIRKP